MAQEEMVEYLVNELGIGDVSAHTDEDGEYFLLPFSMNVFVLLTVAAEIGLNCRKAIVVSDPGIGYRIYTELR